MRQIKKTSLLLFAVIFAIALVVLARSVWASNQYGIVLTGSNWQDTPLHYEIIESLNNGNFPPQMPNFAGVPMTYYYFVDFHTAIIENVFGYLPQLLPFLNAVFIAIFGLAIYALDPTQRQTSSNHRNGHRYFWLGFKLLWALQRPIHRTLQCHPKLRLPVRPKRSGCRLSLTTCSSNDRF